MGRPTIRVSEWALVELRRRASEEGRTVVSVVDRLLGRAVVAAPPTAQDVRRGRTVEVDAMSEWQPIASAPKDGTRVLVYDGYYQGVYLASWREGIDASEHDWSKRFLWFVYESEDPFYSWSLNESQLTHWRPLPDAPA